MKPALLAITILSASVALTLPGCAGPRASSPPAHTPEGIDRMGPLRLSDDEFWTAPTRTRNEIQAPYMSEKREALLFDAPSVVDVDARQTAPTQALRVAKFATLSQRPFRGAAIVVTVDEYHNTVRADLAVAPPTRETDPNTPAYSGPPVEGMGSEVFTIDLRKRLELPWQTGRQLARLIVWDQLTDAREIEFVKKGFVDPAVEKYREKEAARTNVPTLFPYAGPDFTGFRQDKSSPALPSEEGIALTAPRVLDLGRPDACVLQGAFRLPALRRHVVPRSGSPREGAEVFFRQTEEGKKPGSPVPTAVVPITLIATGSSITGPKLWRLTVPSFDPVDPADPRPVVTGYFSVNLRSLDGFDVREQTVFLYAFSSRSSAGPVTIGLTRTPDTK